MLYMLQKALTVKNVIDCPFVFVCLCLCLCLCLSLSLSLSPT